MSGALGQLWQGLLDAGRAEFLVQPGARTSYAALRAWIGSACALFDDHDLQQGDRVTIAIADELAASATFLAALMDGLVPVMLSYEATPERQADRARFVGAALQVTSHVRPAPPKQGLLGRWSGGPKARAPSLPDVAEDDLAYILFTSGSTAAPRGIEITHKNLFAQMATLARLFGFAPGARIVNAAPLAHTDGLVQGPVLAAATGATLVRPGRFEVSDMEPWLDFIRGETPTHMITNPTLLALLHRLAPEADCFSSDRFRSILCTGGVLPEALWDAVEARFAVEVCNVYGMTETVANALYAGRHAQMGARGSIGRPVDCAARIAGGATEGELELSGDNLSPGYWQDGDRTRGTRTEDGWFRTGDIVRMRSDGSFDFVGRMASVINQGAVRIHPEEINEVLAEHPNVLDQVTVGLPDPDFEQIAVSAVTVSAPVEISALHGVCAERLEPLRRPKAIVVVEAIPRTETGKPDLGALQALLAARGTLEFGKEASAGEEALEQQVIGIVAEVFGVAPTQIGLTALPDDIPGWDSFNHIKLMMEVEAGMGISFETREIVAIRSVQALIDAVTAHRARLA